MCCSNGALPCWVPTLGSSQSLRNSKTAAPAVVAASVAPAKDMSREKGGEASPSPLKPDHSPMEPRRPGEQSRTAEL